MFPAASLWASSPYDAVIDWIRRAAKISDVVASVCTGAFPLALAWLLDGRTATTHWEDQSELSVRFPAIDVLGDARWVDHGPVATLAGVSAGTDLALYLVARLHEESLAIGTARQMDCRWIRDGASAAWLEAPARAAFLWRAIS